MPEKDWSESARAYAKEHAISEFDADVEVDEDDLIYDEDGNLKDEYKDF